MNRSDLREILRLDRLHNETNGEKGAKADFSYQDLSKANFSGCDLRGIDFKYCNLQFAKFNGCLIYGCDFKYCNLTLAYLMDTNIMYTDFSHSSVGRAHLDRAEILDCPGI